MLQKCWVRSIHTTKNTLFAENEKSMTWMFWYMATVECNALQPSHCTLIENHCKDLNVCNWQESTDVFFINIQDISIPGANKDALNITQVILYAHCAQMAKYWNKFNFSETKVHRYTNDHSLESWL